MAGGGLSSKSIEPTRSLALDRRANATRCKRAVARAFKCRHLAKSARRCGPLCGRVSVGRSLFLPSRALRSATRATRCALRARGRIRNRPAAHQAACDQIRSSSNNSDSSVRVPRRELQHSRAHALQASGSKRSKPRGVRQSITAARSDRFAQSLRAIGGSIELLFGLAAVAAQTRAGRRDSCVERIGQSRASLIQVVACTPGACGQLLAGAQYSIGQFLFRRRHRFSQCARSCDGRTCNRIC